jgi:hypothetical protein
MYTVKVSNFGTIAFRGKHVRLPATFNKVSEKELKLLKVICRSMSLQYEILEAESERIFRVAEKARADSQADYTEEIENTETKIEDLFDSDDTLGSLLKNVEKDKK